MCPILYNFMISTNIQLVKWKVKQFNLNKLKDYHNCVV